MEKIISEIFSDAEPRTNIEIDHDASMEWSSILKTLWDVLGKPINPTQFSAYVKALSDVPLGLLENAIIRTVNKHTYANIPTPGEIRKEINAILVETQTYSIEQWVEASWSRVMRISREIGRQNV